MRAFEFIIDLQGKSDGDANDEQKKRHDEISQIAAVPRSVSNHWPVSSGVIHQNHQLLDAELEICFSRKLKSLELEIWQK